MADTRKGQTSRKMTHASLKVKVDLEHLFYENREGGGGYPTKGRWREQIVFPSPTVPERKRNRCWLSTGRTWKITLEQKNKGRKCTYRRLSCLPQHSLGQIKQMTFASTCQLDVGSSRFHQHVTAIFNEKLGHRLVEDVGGRTNRFVPAAAHGTASAGAPSGRCSFLEFVQVKRREHIGHR